MYVHRSVYSKKKVMVSYILSLVLLLGGGLQIGVRAQSETEETNTFSILTYNIAGLPGFFLAQILQKKHQEDR